MTFAIISGARSGTHMLRLALSQHPDIHVSHELLNPDRLGHRFGEETAETIIREWQQEHYREVKQLGSLLHRDLYNRSEEIPGDPWRDVRRSHAKFISLYRYNLLRKVLSGRTAFVHKNWQCTSPRTKELPPITLDPDHLESHCRKEWRSFGLVDARLPRHFVISYEDLVSDWTYHTMAMQEYLGVTPVQLHPRTHKQETRSLREAIANYDEIADRVCEMGCEDWLEE